MTEPFIKKTAIAHSFSQAAATYDQAAFIQKEVGQRLLDRLDFIKAHPEAILDVGAGTGKLTRQLQRRYRRSQVIGIDIAPGMIEHAKNQSGWEIWRNKPHYLCADLEALPFSAQQFDLVFSNFTLQWCFNLPQAFAEFKRILKPQGILIFSTLGPQTLLELRQSWAQVNDAIHVNAFMEMHHIGDMLHRQGFLNPVVDREILTLTYPDVRQLLVDLKATGAHNMNAGRAPGFTPKSHYYQMLQAYQAFKTHEGLFPATFEVIYGYAIQATSLTHKAEEDGIIRIPGDKIPLLNF